MEPNEKYQLRKKRKYENDKTELNEKNDPKEDEEKEKDEEKEEEEDTTTEEEEEEEIYEIPIKKTPLLYDCTSYFERYNVILADPPWKYNNNKFISGSADSQYETMKELDLEQLKIDGQHTIDHFCDPECCILLMWTTGPKADTAIDLMRAWGFRYITKFMSWIKDGDKLMGNTTRQACEDVLMGSMGKCEKLKKLTVPFIKNYFIQKPDEHSRKPTYVKQVISRIFENVPKIELFARDSSDPNYDYYGNESELFGKRMCEEHILAIREEQKKTIELIKRYPDRMQSKKGKKIKLGDNRNVFGLERNKQQSLLDFFNKIK